MKQKLDWEAPVKSSEDSGSGDKKGTEELTIAVMGAGNFNINETDEERILKQKTDIIELSNKSVLHGFDMAVELLGIAGEEAAVKSLIESRSIIEIGLKNGTEDRAKDNE
jgi:hypothetical protein